jgi:hypothetical protein
MSQSRSSLRMSAFVLTLAVITASVVLVPQAQPAPASQSTIIHVDNTDDFVGDCSQAGQCTLRTAIIQANTTPGHHTLILEPVTYSLTLGGSEEHHAHTGDLDIRDDLEIIGNFATVDGSGMFDPEDPGSNDRVLYIRNGSEVRIEHLIVTGGQAGVAGDTQNRRGGGGILVHNSDAVLDGVILHGNSATGLGGGLFASGVSGSTTITQSVIAANHAWRGGGLQANAPVEVEWSTVASNTADPGEIQGAIAGSGSLSLTGSIVALHDGTNCGGAVASGGHNISDDTSCSNFSTALGDHPDEDPMFASYSGNLHPDSPVGINAGGQDCPPIDLLGVARPRGGACDIGPGEVIHPLIVDDPTDLPSLAPGDGVCATALQTCTLRAAVQEANALAGQDTIVLAPHEHYALSIPGAQEDHAATGDLDIRRDVALLGNHAIIDGGNLDRVFHVLDGASVTLTEVGVTGGTVTGTGVAGHGGGALVADGHLLVQHSSFWNNHASVAGGSLAVRPAGSLELETSTISSSTAGTTGGAMHVAGNAEIAWSTIADNAAGGSGGAAGITAPPFEPPAQPGVSLKGSIVANPNHAGTDCNQPLRFLSLGYNADSDGSCGLNDSSDLPSVDAQLEGLRDLGTLPVHKPTATSPVVNAGPSEGSCPDTDQVGHIRPDEFDGGTAPACDLGSVEYSTTDWESVERSIIKGLHIATDQSYEPCTLGVGNCSFGHDWIEDTVTRAYSNYLLAPFLGPSAEATAAGHLATLHDQGDGFGHGSYPAVETGEHSYPGRFATPLLLRMRVIEDLPAWSSTDPVQVESRQAVDGMIDHFRGACIPPDQWGSSNLSNGDPWHQRGTENHAAVLRTNCVLALYHLDVTDSAGNDWADWAAIMTEHLQERVRTGLLNEVQSPGYGQTTLMGIYNMADFPVVAGTSVDDDLRRAARQFLDIYWHDVAHSYNAQTGTVSSSGTRMYPPNADVPNANNAQMYAQPHMAWEPHWAALYGWGPEPTSKTRFQVLVALSSFYTPLPISTALAMSEDKDIHYVSMRPNAADPSSNVHHGVRRDVFANDDFLLGSMTFGWLGTQTFDEHGKLALKPNGWAILDHKATENEFFALSVNSAVEDRMVIAPAGDRKHPTNLDRPTVGSWFSMHGIAVEDGLIAGRDHRAGPPPIFCWDPENPPSGLSGPRQISQTACPGNSRGLRVYFGPGELRDNLEIGDPEAPGGSWSYTVAGDTYVAVWLPEGMTFESTPEGAVSALRAVHDKACHEDPAIDCPDVWAPVVVQVTRGAQIEAAILDIWPQHQNPSDPALKWHLFTSWVEENPPVTDSQTKVTSYTTVSGTLLEFQSQEDAYSAPKVGTPGAGTSDIEVNPPMVYQSGHITLPWGGDTAKLWGPAGAAGTQVTIRLGTD